MCIENFFFELLQVAIGTRQSLSFAPSANQWSELLFISKKQALAAVTFCGVRALANTPVTHNLSEVTYLKWLGLTAKVAQRNKALDAECDRICKEFAHDGLLPVVLKGQSNLVYYPENLRNCRTAGDIDLWCNVPEGVEVAHEVNGKVEKREYRGMEGVIEYCKQYERCQGRDIPWYRVLYYHCELTSPEGIGIEPHYRPSYLNSPIRNYRLQRWFKDNEPWGMCDAKIDGHIFPILPISTNVVYQLLHIYKHLFEEGIGLRQLLDYYFVLRALHIEQGGLSPNNLQSEGEKPDHWQSMAQWAEGMGIGVKSNAEIMHTLSRFGMKKFASAVMYVLQTVFAKPDEYLICQPNEKEGRFLLSEIMQAGNFGKYDDRIARGSNSFMGFNLSPSISHAIEKTKHNLHLLSHYPEEVICEPFFRNYHWFWRRLELWRY